MENSEVFPVYKYLLSIQVPNQEIASTQPVSDESRAKTIEWMSNVCSNFDFENEVLHLSVIIFDKYLCLCDITDNHLQLLASACIFISCKYENVYTPKVSWFINAMDKTATKKDLLEMESNILEAIDFKLGCPTINVFLSIFGELLSLEKKNQYLASYYSELSLLTTSSHKFSSLSLAASSIVLANIVLKETNPWPQHVGLVCNLDLVKLEECIKYIHALACAALEFTPTKGTRDKFGGWSFDSVSLLDQPDNLER